MSSTSTTWTTDTNTKSGTVQVYESSVSTLRITAGESTDAILELFADQGDDNADKWRMWVNNSDNDLHFTSYTSGAWVDKLTIQDGGNVGIGTDAPDKLLHISSTGTAEIHIDGGANAYLLLDASSDSDDSKVIFQKNGVSIGSIDYDHNATETSALMKFNLNIAGSADPQMAIKADGSVGIGTTTPDTLLHLSGEDTAILRLENTDASLEANQLIGAVEWEKVDSSGAGAGVVGSIDMRSTDSTGTGAYMDFHVGSSSGNNAFAMRIDALGNVGIGTTSPGTILDIDSGAAGESSAEAAGIRITGQRNGNIQALTMRHEDASGGNTDADEGIGMHFQGYDGSNSYHDMGAIYVRSAETSVSDSDSPGYMSFFTTPNASDTLAERMRIDKDGKVGIGTASPSSLLHIQADSTATTAPTEVLRLEVIDADTDLGIGEGPAIDFYVAEYDNISEWGARIACVRQNATDSQADASLAFWTGANDASPTEKMRITKDGDVGIGTNDPSYKLHIESSGIAMFAKTTGTNYAARFQNTNGDDSSDGIIILVGSDAPDVGGYWIACQDNANSSAETEWGVRGDGTDAGATIYDRSDRRSKENIVDIPDALSIVSNLKPRNFTWKAKNGNAPSGKLQYGFIADEYDQVFPNFVYGKRDSDGKLILDAKKYIDDEGNETDGSTGTEVDAIHMLSEKPMIALLTKAIQELSAKVTALESA